MATCKHKRDRRMTTKLEALQHESADAAHNLEHHETLLRAERAKPNPQRDDVVRFREAVKKAQATCESILEDIETEQARLNSPEVKAAMAAARARRNAVLDAQVLIGQRWLRFEQLMRATIDEGKTLTAQVNSAAGDATATAWAHHSDRRAAGDEAGRAVDTLMGLDSHAFALASLLRELLEAVPAGLRNRLSLYLGFEETAMAGRPRITFADATQVAERELRQQLGRLLPEGPAPIRTIHDRAGIPGQGPDVPKGAREALAGQGPERTRITRLVA